MLSEYYCINNSDCSHISLQYFNYLIENLIENVISLINIGNKSQHCGINFPSSLNFLQAGLLLMNVTKVFWHERSAFQRSAFGRSTAGNDVVATISISLLARACGVPAVGVRAVDCWQ